MHVYLSECGYVYACLHMHACAYVYACLHVCLQACLLPACLPAYLPACLPAVGTDLTGLLAFYGFASGGFGGGFQQVFRAVFALFSGQVFKEKLPKIHLISIKVHFKAL